MLILLLMNAAIIGLSLYIWGKILPYPFERMTSLTLRLIGGVIFGLMASLVMIISHPISGYLPIDLRYIPIVLAAVYGGMWSAVSSILILVLAQAYLSPLYVANVSHAALIAAIAGVLMLDRFVKESSTKFWSINIFVVFCYTASLHSLIRNRLSLHDTLTEYIPLTLLCGQVIYLVLRDVQSYQRMFSFYQTHATKDFLTGLGNARLFDAYVNRWKEEAKQKLEPLSLILIDIDRFKEVNDTYGHDAGDTVLQQVAHVLQDTTRLTDQLFRNGGEEFSVLIKVGHEEALMIGERVRQAIQAAKFTLPSGKQIAVTVSIGVSTCYETGMECSAFVKQADMALYRAKEEGRNQLVSAQSLHLRATTLGVR